MTVARREAVAAERDACYFRCLLTSFVISNMFTDALPPNTAFSVGVGVDHAPVLLVLQAVLLDVGPQLLGDLGARHRLRADDLGQRRAGRHRLHEGRIRFAGGLLFHSLFCHAVSYRRRTSVEGEYHEMGPLDAGDCGLVAGEAIRGRRPRCPSLNRTRDRCWYRPSERLEMDEVGGCRRDELERRPDDRDE